MRHNHLLITASLALALTVGGCSFLGSKPDSTEAKLGLDGIDLAATFGCDLLGEKVPKVINEVVSGLDAATALMEQKRPYNDIVSEFTARIKNKRVELYLGKALARLDTYVNQESGLVIDRDTVGYQGLDALIAGCRSGLAIHMQSAAVEHCPVLGVFGGGSSWQG